MTLAEKLSAWVVHRSALVDKIDQLQDALVRSTIDRDLFAGQVEAEERTIDRLYAANGDLHRDLVAEQARTADLAAALRRHEEARRG